MRRTGLKARIARTVHLIPVTALALTSACVESFSGSWMEFELGVGVHVPEGDFPGNGQPPSGTHYEFWVVTGNNAFKMAEFQVVPVIDPAFPCFIEDEETRYPGLHSTMILDRVKADSNLANPSTAELGRLADAQVREENQGKVEAGLKAVVVYDSGVDPATLTALAASVPAKEMIDDAANAQRRKICQDFYGAHPNFYVGNDRVYSLPLNGVFLGLVKGTNPINAAPVGGAGMASPVSLASFDELWVNWQFNDLNDPRIENFMGRGYGKSATGYHYLRGRPQKRTRDIINVPLTNAQFPSITAEVAIYPAIQDDDVHF